MNRLISAFHVDAAELAHQQAGNQRGDRVRDFIGQHHRHHQRQAEQGVRCLSDGRRHLVNLGRQIEHDKIMGFRLQLADRLPVADHQQDIAQRQGLIHQLARQGFAIAANTDHVQIITATESGFAQAFPQ
ncbi:hypothetical protein D3C73_1249110 [compost metagenome]